MTQEELEHCIRSAAVSVLLGHKVSELDRLADVRDEYRFLMSRKVGDQYRSYSVTYGTLLDQLAKDVVDVLGLSSMAFHEDYEYAPFDHRHDGVYDYTTVSPTFGPSDFAPGEAIRHVCSVLTSNHGGSGVVAIPYPPKALTKGQPQPTPYIGEFRMHAGRHMYDQARIRDDIRDGTFDGWVYADGGSYDRYMGKYDFSEAYVHYNGSGTAFRVPLFQDFIRLNGTPDGIRKNGYGWVKYVNGIGKHSHDVSQLQEDIKDQYVDATLTINTMASNTTTWPAAKIPDPEKPGKTKTRPGADGLHSQYKTKDSELTGIGIDIEANGIGADVSFASSGNDIETKPYHHILPGMVYIGTKER